MLKGTLVINLDNLGVNGEMENAIENNCSVEDIKVSFRHVEIEVKK